MGAVSRFFAHRSMGFFYFLFWKIGGTMMTKQLNWFDFFNDKELWFKWFVRTDLPEDTKKQCRDWMDLDLFDLNWRVSLGVTVKWESVKDHLPESAAFEHLGEYKTVFLNLHQSFLEEGKEDIPGNYWIWVYHAKTNVEFAIPHQAVGCYYRAGWPREGWDPRLYIVEPWQYLRPIREYLDGVIRLEEVKKQLPRSEYGLKQGVMRFIKKGIVSWIDSSPEENDFHAKFWMEILEKLYQMAMEMNQSELKSKYLNFNPYTGVAMRDFPLGLLDDKEQLMNPLMRFFKLVCFEIKKI
jgi:hypothetical protein